MGFACTCKRGMVLASAIFVIISGAIVAYASFYLAFSSVGENTGNKKIFMWTGVIEAIIVLLIFILGLVASCTDKPNKPVISIFIILLAIIVAGFVFAFVFVIRGKSSYRADVNNVCLRKGDVTGLINELSKIYVPKLSDNFCTLDCPCNANRDNFTTADYLNMVTSPSGISAINKCPNFKNLYPENQMPSNSLLSIMTLLEVSMDCSGLCEPELYYLFSDVAKGMPKNSCKENIVGFIDKYFLFVAISSIVIAAFYLAAIFAGFCLCCEKGPEDAYDKINAMK